MNMPGEEWRHCRFHRGGVTHLGIFVAGLERCRDRVPSTHSLHTLCGSIGEEFIFRTVNPAHVHFWSSDMSMDFNGARHNCLPFGIDDLRPGADLIDNLAILDGDVRFVPLDTLYRVKHISVPDDIF